MRIASLGEPPTPHPESWSIDDLSAEAGSDDDSDDSDGMGDGVRDEEMGVGRGAASVAWSDRNDGSMIAGGGGVHGEVLRGMCRSRLVRDSPDAHRLGVKGNNGAFFVPVYAPGGHRVTGWLHGRVAVIVRESPAQEAARAVMLRRETLRRQALASPQLRSFFVPLAASGFSRDTAGGKGQSGSDRDSDLSGEESEGSEDYDYAIVVMPGGLISKERGLRSPGIRIPHPVQWSQAQLKAFRDQVKDFVRHSSIQDAGGRQTSLKLTRSLHMRCGNSVRLHDDQGVYVGYPIQLEFVGLEWTVIRRYRQFVALDAALRAHAVALRAAVELQAKQVAAEKQALREKMDSDAATREWQLGIGSAHSSDVNEKLQKRFGAAVGSVHRSKGRSESIDGPESFSGHSVDGNDADDAEAQALGDKEAFLRVMSRRLGIEQLPNVPSKFHLASALGNRLAESRREAFQDYLRDLAKLPFVWQHPAFIRFLDSPSRIIYRSQSYLRALALLRG